MLDVCCFPFFGNVWGQKFKSLSFMPCTFGQLFNNRYFQLINTFKPFFLTLYFDPPILVLLNDRKEEELNGTSQGLQL